MGKSSSVMRWFCGIVIAVVVSLSGCAGEDPVGIQSDAAIEVGDNGADLDVLALGKQGNYCRKMPKLVAFYPFRGNARDKSFSRNHAQVYGATLTEDRFGRPNNAYDFDGVDDYIEATDTRNLQLSSWTLAGWIKLHKSLEHNGMIAWKVEGANEKYNFAATISTFDGPEVPRVTAQYEICEDETDFDHFVFSEPVETEAWMFFAVTRDEKSGEVRTYVDGELHSSDDGGDDRLDKGSNSLNIGRAANEGFYFDGLIDEAMIWNRALTASEIKKLAKKK